MDKDRFERQMSAIIGKSLSSLETMIFIQQLKPFELDKIRKRLISVAWESYLVGRKKGLEENLSNGNFNTA